MKKLTAIGSSLFAYLTYTGAALAQITVDPCPKGQGGGEGQFTILCSVSGDRFGGLIGWAITVIFIISVIVALLYLIWGGFKWLTSGGDKAKVEGARNTIIAAVIGLIIIFLSYFILDFLLGLFGLGSINTLVVPTL